LAKKEQHVVVIGAGVGGLTAASLLLNAGLPVTVLEAHVYAGGSAGTFFHKGYHFDAGATLAGGFSPGGPHERIAQILGLTWPVSPVDPAWVVHLPDKEITQWADQARWEAERHEKLPGTEKFWRLQEKLAEISWDISARAFPWPPQEMGDLWTLAKALRPSTMGAAPYLARTMDSLARSHFSANGRGLAEFRDFSTFLDAQLLISAQTTAERANALYGSAALDLPRRGVNHVHGGIGNIAGTLAEWFRKNGGELYFRQQVEELTLRHDDSKLVRTNKGMEIAADIVLANLTPWGLANLLGDQAPASVQQTVRETPPTWGAFTLYLGLDAADLPAGITDHHQVVVDPERPLGEGNSVFVSLSDRADETRAPAGHRAATLSTHTAIAPWWRLKDHDYEAYEARRAQYAERMLAAAERAVPGLRKAVRLCLPGTPVTFERFTRRPQGMVGGFAQESLFAARGPATGLPGVWLVGDSIFPGQSTAGVTVGAIRVAREVLSEGSARE
jgi:C-3',4' desaturase CrtD